MRTRTVTAFLLLGLLSVTGWAADARGCKDHPLFTRMSGYQLAACEKKFEQLVIKLDEDPDAARNPHPEGDRSKSRYEWDDAAGTPPDFLQVLRNYQKAYDEKNKTFRQTPLHNWASHGADAIRQLGVSYVEQTRTRNETRPKRRKASAWV